MLRNQEMLGKDSVERSRKTVANDNAPVIFRSERIMGKRFIDPKGIHLGKNGLNSPLYLRGEDGAKRSAHVCNVASTQVAKLFSLFLRKGTIQPGVTPTLVVFAPNYRGADCLPKKRADECGLLARLRAGGNRGPPEV